MKNLSKDQIDRRNEDIVRYHKEVQELEDACRQKASDKKVTIKYEVKDPGLKYENLKCTLHVGNQTSERLLTKHAPTETLKQIWEDDARAQLWEWAQRVLTTEEKEEELEKEYASELAAENVAFLAKVQKLEDKCRAKAGETNTPIKYIAKKRGRKNVSCIFTLDVGEHHFRKLGPGDALEDDSLYEAKVRAFLWQKARDVLFKN